MTGPANMQARAHADRWLTAWNARDLEDIMRCYSEDVDFVAPTVAARWGRPSGQLRGKDELRAHFARGLALAPDSDSRRRLSRPLRPDTRSSTVARRETWSWM